MSESDWLLHNIIEGGDFVGRDDAGRMVVVLAIGPRDFEQLLTFGAVEVESECSGDNEPYECTPMSPCWAWEAARAFAGVPTLHQVHVHTLRVLPSATRTANIGRSSCKKPSANWRLRQAALH